MTEKTYKRMVSTFKESKVATSLLWFANKILPLVFYIAYPLMLIIKATGGIDREFIRMLIVPLAVFLGVTVMRKLINRPRPYEKFGTDPVIPNERKGLSFPSRHTASAFIVALSAFYISIPLGIVLCLIALDISACRVFSGIHFISDVLFGAFISSLFGVLFFFII